MSSSENFEKQKGGLVQTNLTRFFPKKTPVFIEILTEKNEVQLQENLNRVEITKIGRAQDSGPSNEPTDPVPAQLEKREILLKDREEEIRKLIARTIELIQAEPAQLTSNESEFFKKLILTYILDYKRWNVAQKEPSPANTTPAPPTNDLLLQAMNHSKLELNGFCKQLTVNHNLLVDPSIWESVETCAKENGLTDFADLLHGQRKHRVDQIMHRKIEEVNKQFFQKLMALNLPHASTNFKPVIPFWNS